MMTNVGIGEVDIFGILFPPLLIWLGIAVLANAGFRWLLNRLGLYRFVWHRPLFDLALLVILLGGVSLLAENLL
jgi:hypothetical protein